MRIDNGLSVTAVNAVRGVRTRQVEEPGEGPDAADFSRHAADIGIALEALQATPDVREDQVQELKTQLDQGTFVIDEQALAEKLLGPNHS